MLDEHSAGRGRSERLVVRGATTRLPTPYGVFTAHGYDDLVTRQTHVALTIGAVADGGPVLLRPHSECLTGDVFASQRCDCRAQLLTAIEMIGTEGRGVVLYLRQEGRGIGLMDKLRAYALQDEGLDTVQANQHLGLPVDMRDYGVAQQILVDLGVRRLRVLSNNPKKYYGLAAYGLEVVDHIPLRIPPNEHNHRYLRVKRDKLGHLIGPFEEEVNTVPGQTPTG